MVEWGVAVAAFVVYIDRFVPATDHQIRIHDTFDGNFSTRHVLISSGYPFEAKPTATVPGIMGGLPRAVCPRATEITSLLMYALGSLPGFSINFILIRIIAALGMFLFLRDHCVATNLQSGLLALISLAFACLPFF